jgi:putative FmdB family regulatory protein
MPLYEYQCAKCGKKSEFIQKFSDPHETTCPRCGGALKKLLSSPAFQFKGSGFYATDYGNSGKPEKGDEKSSSKGEEGSGGGEAKSEKAEKAEKAEKGEDKKTSSKGEEGGGGSESKGDSSDAKESRKDSSKSKKRKGNRK